MPHSFEFATAQQIHFGAGKARLIATLARELGSRALVVTGSKVTHISHLLNEWQALGIVAETVSAGTEPSVNSILEATSQARQSGCDLVIAIGGGSVMDTGKAVAALLTNPGEPLDYLEVIGRGKALNVPSAPLIAAPTTAGTGAEVTRNAVLSVPEQKIKVILRSPTMLPRVALVDPELSYSAPSSITASTGLDTLTQCIEPFVSNQANPLTDGAAQEGIRAAANSLLRAYQDGNDTEAREGMSVAALCGGLALANAKLGAVHGFAGVIGGMFPIPHGVICARLLPYVMATNVQALAERAPTSGYLERFDQVAKLLTGDDRSTAYEGVTWLLAFCDELEIPKLGTYGLLPNDFEEIITKSKVASSMKGNPIALNDHELTRILEAAL